jgi:hypothetical protein
VASGTAAALVGRTTGAAVGADSEEEEGASEFAAVFTVLAPAGLTLAGLTFVGLVFGRAAFESRRDANPTFELSPSLACAATFTGCPARLGTTLMFPVPLCPFVIDPGNEFAPVCTTVLATGRINFGKTDAADSVAPPPSEKNTENGVTAALAGRLREVDPREGSEAAVAGAEFEARGVGAIGGAPIGVVPIGTATDDARALATGSETAGAGLIWSRFATLALGFGEFSTPVTGKVTCESLVPPVFGRLQRMICGVTCGPLFPDARSVGGAPASEDGEDGAASGEKS